MTQVPSYQIPAHPSGLDMRTQLNAIVLALVGDNSGPTAPTVTYPGMMWGDTTANRLKRRTNANDAWIDLGPIDNFLADVTATANNKVSRTGDTMTGALTLANTSGTISYALVLKSGSYAPQIRSQTYSGSGWEFVNGANNAVPLNISDGGNVTATGMFYTGSGVVINGYGSLQLAGAAGRAYLRADAAMTNGYGAGALGSGLINNANNAWNLQMSDNGNYGLRGFSFLDISRVGNNGDSNGYRHVFGSGWMKQNEYNYGPYIDFSRAASEDWKWRIHYNFNNQYLEFIMNGGGSVVFATDGNINSSSQGWFSGKAGAGARVQWDSGINEWGPINGPTTLDMGAPWVMEGWRTNSNGNWVSGAQWIRGVVLRNQ
ncbi:hypothetical protein P9281_27375 [Caballeronia sp. LP003]|uniref:hypothetical protein n=1 Tax=Caballeronia sp. LP003 TaxID=3038551 RepID=UPI002859BA6D|nr:hypothetical protein [Caballeronia sp. LP003]MDR5790271.1 hypothetical protein [Caballeronia sp. LP003]